MPRWNNPNCGFQKEHPQYRKTGVYKHSEETKKKIGDGGRKTKQGSKNYICLMCYKNFISYKSDNNKFCSKHCHNKSKLGKSTWNKGKPIPQIQGKNHYAWKGGITPINYKIRNSLKYKLWRDKVFKRDDYTCQECSKKGVYLEAHHIKSFSKYPKLRFTIKNGRTLCLKCHDKFRKELFV